MAVVELIALVVSILLQLWAQHILIMNHFVLQYFYFILSDIFGSDRPCKSTTLDNCLTCQYGRAHTHL